MWYHGTTYKDLWMRQYLCHYMQVHFYAISRVYKEMTNNSSTASVFKPNKLCKFRPQFNCTECHIWSKSTNHECATK